jgi:hypothetical protein
MLYGKIGTGQSANVTKVLRRSTLDFEWRLAIVLQLNASPSS